MINLSKGEKLIPAPIDGKNVTSDWIDSILDVDTIERNRIVIGMVKDCVVQVSWEGNKMEWIVSELGKGDMDEALAYIFERLKEYDGYTKLVCKTDMDGYTITQMFYYKED